MTLRVENVQTHETTKAQNNARTETQQEQTFNYQPTEDDKNIGLKVQTKSNKAAKASNTQKQNKQSTGDLILNRAGFVVMTPIAGVAGVLTIVAGGAYGLLNPNSTFEQGMQKGIEAAGQGADMLQKMWEGRYF